MASYPTSSPLHIIKYAECKLYLAQASLSFPLITSPHYLSRVKWGRPSVHNARLSASDCLPHLLLRTSEKTDGEGEGEREEE